MIVLDTNVISELWKIKPDTNVLDWINAQTIETLYLSVVSVAEIRYGVATMPTGKRRKIYHDRLELEVLPAFNGRVLAFDLDVSSVYAQLMAEAKAKGKLVGKNDGYIAVIAAHYSFIMATCDTSSFESVGVPVINPWIQAPRIH